jgi:hypothetical protein
LQIGITSLTGTGSYPTPHLSSSAYGKFESSNTQTLQTSRHQPTRPLVQRVPQCPQPRVSSARSSRVPTRPYLLRPCSIETNSTVGEIPSMKIFESEKTYAFLDIGPLSRGHSVRSISLDESNSYRCPHFTLTRTSSSSSLNTTAPNCTISPTSSSPKYSQSLRKSPLHKAYKTTTSYRTMGALHTKW